MGQAEVTVGAKPEGTCHAIVGVRTRAILGRMRCATQQGNDQQGEEPLAVLGTSALHCAKVTIALVGEQSDFLPLAARPETSAPIGRLQHSRPATGPAPD